MNTLALIGTLALAALPAYSQGTPDKVNVPLSDPARPATVRVSLVMGSIHVKGYAGNQVIVEAKNRAGQSGREESSRDGLRRIPLTSTGLEVEEDNNVVKIGTASFNHAVDLDIQVPLKTSLKLKTVNDGEITVTGVEGDHEVSDINGPVTLTGISGSAVAHSLNDKLKVVFTQIDPQKPMSFSSLNGDIDVTFPASLKANVKLKTQQGEIFTDFDVAVHAAPKQAVEESGSGKGKFRVKLDQTLYGSINGGGPEFQFSNFNGSIYIRKGK